MITQSTDTHPDIEKVLITLIRKLDPPQKISQVRSLSQTIILLSRRAIARANKNMNENEVNLLFVSLHYGKELADRVHNYLEKRDAGFL